jgi:hypothetical protein
MTTNSGMPLWMKVLSWGNSILGKIGNRAAIARDAGLKTYVTELSWTDTTRAIRLEYDVIANDEAHARQLSNTQAVIDEPTIPSPLEGREITPPYMKDPASTLALWKVKEVPLTDGQREFAKQGKLGPARTSPLRRVMAASTQP